jgi:hypothetical protein
MVQERKMVDDWTVIFILTATASAEILGCMINLWQLTRTPPSSGYPIPSSPPKASAGNLPVPSEIDWITDRDGFSRICELND